MKNFSTRSLPALAAVLLLSFNPATAQRSASRHRPAHSRSRVVYLTVDRPAAFQGNLDAYLRSELIYPRDARQQRQTGKVELVFGIDADGTVRNVTVHSSSGHPALDNEALRVVRRMPKWSPAEKNGHTVKSNQLLPVVFYLDQPQ